MNTVTRVVGTVALTLAALLGGTSVAGANPAVPEADPCIVHGTAGPITDRAVRNIFPSIWVDNPATGCSKWIWVDFASYNDAVPGQSRWTGTRVVATG